MITNENKWLFWRFPITIYPEIKNAGGTLRPTSHISIPKRFVWDPEKFIETVENKIEQTTCNRKKYEHQYLDTRSKRIHHLPEKHFSCSIRNRFNIKQYEKII